MAKRDGFLEPAEELDDDPKAHKEKKKEKKSGKKGNKKKNAEDDDSEESVGSKLVLFVVTILIIAIWVGILAILIRSDVGGFGSSVLYPILKDVPYVNRILPEPEAVYPDDENQMPYRSLDEALARIRELEKDLDAAIEKNSDDAATIADLQQAIDELSVYKEEEAAFEKEKQKFYEEVVLSDVSPDINEYRAYYESIDPENAAVLYKQVIAQISYDDSVADYVKTYSQMQPKAAADIFNTMTNNMGLVAEILTNMGAKARADILAEMEPELAARLTEIMEPDR